LDGIERREPKGSGRRKGVDLTQKKSRTRKKGGDERKKKRGAGGGNRGSQGDGLRESELGLREEGLAAKGWVAKRTFGGKPAKWPLASLKRRGCRLGSSWENAERKEREGGPHKECSEKKNKKKPTKEAPGKTHDYPPESRGKKKPQRKDTRDNAFRRQHHRRKEDLGRSKNKRECTRAAEMSSGVG